ncbi:MAG TPA: ABC transporter permease [Gemmatimonadaceae bacterium]|nr:ABC transporter permease [Gemmatimonadaceae bacterium]
MESHPPPQVPRWRRYIRFWRANVKADVDDEFQFHIQEHIDDLIARGMAPDRARDEALRRFGDIEKIKDACRVLAQDQENRMRRTEMLGVARQDALYAFRLMRANPGFATAVALTLALGIGATTAIFSVVHSVLLRPLPYADSDRIVTIFETLGGGRGRASAGHFYDWTEQSRVLAATSAWQQRTYNLTDGEPERLFGARVTPSFFQVLHIPPAVGRYFLPEETAASRVTVLSYGMWQTRFNGDSAIVGKQITLDGEKHTVVGVTPAALTLTTLEERLWTPLTFEPEQRTNYGAHTFLVTGKLKPGVTIEQAQNDLVRVTEDIRRRHPDNMEQRGVQVVSFTDVLIGDYRTQLWLLLGAVTFVLLIGCANVASLLLARATARRKEIAIRGALGGGRGRLVRQLLTESFMLAAIGGVLSVGVAYLGVRFLARTGPAWVPRLSAAGLNIEVLLFALGATIVCGLLFGLAPALRATRVDLQSELRIGGRGSGGLVRDRTRATLIVTEFAVALILLVSAGLFLRSAQALQRVPLGFDPNGVTMLRVALPGDRYAEPSQVQTAFTRIVDEVRAIPGVQSAAASTRVPMWGMSIDVGITVDGRARNPDRVELGHIRLATTSFLETIGVPLKRGRLLRDSDLATGAPRVVVVNETFSRNIFGDENPIGKRISFWSGPEPVWREIIGVVGDVRAFGQENEQPPEMYLPLTQAPDESWNAFQRAMTIVAAAPPGVLTATTLRQAVNRIDPLLPLYDVQGMDAAVAQSTASRRFNTMLLTFLGLTGLVLAAIGIYGVIAFFVTQRTHEIGVRVALGASRSRVIRMVVRQAVVLALIGITVGGVAAFWATRVFGSMLFEVGARDPIAYATAAVVLLLVAVAAALLPARRASRVEPVKALATAG